MSLAAAVSAPSGPVAYLTYRPGMSSGDNAEPSVAAPEPAPAPAPGGAEKSSPRYVSLSFTYNQDAARLVMLYRSPSTGETVSQIPSEVALKRYEAAGRPEVQPERKSREFGERGEEKAGLPQQTTGIGKGTGKGTAGGTGTGTSTADTTHAAGTGTSTGSTSTGVSAGDAGSTGTGTGTGTTPTSSGSGSGRVDVVV